MMNFTAAKQEVITQEKLLLDTVERIGRIRDGYVVLRDSGRNAYDAGPGIDEVVRQAFAHSTAFAPRVDGRITTE